MPFASQSTVQLACAACTRMTAHRKLYAKNSYDILQCGGCGLGRTEAGSFDGRSYYTEDYFSGARPDGYADYRGSELILRREFARTVRFIRSFRGSGRLLEIGCAYGFFLQEASRFYDATCLTARAPPSCRLDRENAVTKGTVTIQVIGDRDHRRLDRNRGASSPGE